MTACAVYAAFATFAAFATGSISHDARGRCVRAHEAAAQRERLARSAPEPELLAGVVDAPGDRPTRAARGRADHGTRPGRRATDAPGDRATDAPRRHRAAERLLVEPAGDRRELIEIERRKIHVVRHVHFFLVTCWFVVSNISSLRARAASASKCELGDARQQITDYPTRRTVTLALRP